ncbi:sarcosine oxidase subunit gamma [Jannaschia marina]|uniref:sarcosine oxidase subunit gamma n=1 Tax=Jannaschia marina TaxID=2741674 RepID=UPI0015C95367|nr:sarcosine oxidase subunit gamma family protein [Jannaschia marina]
MSDISIEALPPVGMIALRGEMGSLGRAVEAVTDCAPPEQRMSTRSGDVTVMWMAPDEMLIVCDHGAAGALAQKLTAQLSDVFATVVEVSDARQVFDLTGADVEALLSKLMPVDFDRLGATEVRRTRMAQVPAALWRHSGGYHVMCFRSVAGYAMRLMEDARPVGG